MGKLKKKEFWEAAGARALRTFCQAFLFTGGSALVLSDIDFKYALSASTTMALFSIINSIIAGLPEIKEEEE